MNGFIRRKVLEEVRAHLSKKEITLIAGPRQSGKTTILKKLEQELLKKGEKVVFLNLDIETNFSLVSSQETLLDKIRLEIGEGGGYVFIDEIQRKENAGLFLKGLYDMELAYKFVVSGSGSLELKEKIQESLAGRKRVFDVYPLSFEEFVNFKTKYKYVGRLREMARLEKKKMAFFLKEYLSFGGYPRVVLASEMEEKKKVLEEIFDSYLTRDIAFILGVNKPDQFARLVEYLALNAGKLLNLNGMSMNLDLSVETIKKYLFFLEKTFIIKLIRPFYKNKTSEIVKSPIVYFYDLGVLSRAGGFAVDEDFAFQNFVYLCLRNLFLPEGRINFWRTKGGNEIDFLVESKAKLIPFEVKNKDLKSIKMERSWYYFLEEYESKVEKFYVVNKSLNGKKRSKGVGFEFVTYDFVLP